MGFPSPRLLKTPDHAPATPEATAKTKNTLESSPAAKTARLIEQYKQHAAEWAAEEGQSYVDIAGFSSSSRSMMIFKGGETMFLFTAPLVDGGTKAAFDRFLDACATRQQVEQVQKQYPKSNLIQ